MDAQSALSFLPTTVINPVTAEAASTIDPNNDEKKTKQLRGKALFRAARACYGLRRYEDAHAWLEKSKDEALEDGAGKKEMVRVNERIKEEEGKIDFAGMVQEFDSKRERARSEKGSGKQEGDRWAELDRAGWKGCVQRRECADKGIGRGLFVTKAVKAGSVVLVEKAFAALFPSVADDDEQRRTGEEIRRLRRLFGEKAMRRLERNSSLVEDFAELHSGDADTEIGKGRAEEIDDAFVRKRILLNSFAFFPYQKDAHWNAVKKPEKEVPVTESGDGCMGIWITASFINHSCLPNVQQSMIGDMIIIRAARDLPKDTELRLNYCGDTEDVEDRDEHLKHFGFRCTCTLCTCQRAITPKALKARQEVYAKIVQLFEGEGSTDISTYYELLKELNDTFTTSCIDEPRRVLIVPAINLISACAETSSLDTSLKEYVVRIGLLLLRGLGWEIKVNASKFQVRRWGLLTNEVVAVLADMWTAYGVTCPSVVRQVEKVVKTAYRIMVGEDATFEATYGGSRPSSGGLDEEVDERLMRDPDMLEVVEGMKNALGFHDST